MGEERYSLVAMGLLAGEKMFTTDKQEVIKVTAQGVVEHDKLEAGNLCFASPSTFEAWELDYNQQARNEKTGKLTQFVSSLNKRPLKIYQKRPQAKSQSTQSIAAQQFDEKLVAIHKANQKNLMIIWMGILAVTLTVLIGLIVLFNMG